MINRNIIITVSSSVAFVAACTFLACTTDWSKLQKTIVNIDATIIIAAFIYHMVIDLLRGYKMALLANNFKGTFSDTITYYHYNLASGFYSLVLPGSVFGGGIRWLYFRKSSGNADAAWMIFADNYSQMATVFLIFIPAAFFLPDGFRAGILSIILIAFITITPAFIHHLLYLSFFKNIKVAATRRILDYCERKLPALHLKNRQSITIFLLSLTYQILLVFFIFLCANASGGDIPLHILVIAITGLMVVQYIPGVLGGIGIREASLAGILVPFGVPMEEAVLLGIIISVIGIARGLSGGLAVIYLKSRSFR